MKYDIEFSIEAKQNIERLKKSGDKKLLKKLYAIQEPPFSKYRLMMNVNHDDETKPV